MYRFEHSDWLNALLLVPVMILVFIQFRLGIQKRLKKIGNPILVKKMFGEVSPSKQIIKFIFYSIAFLFAVFGLANLQTGSKIQEVKREGGDIMICLDVSNSMLAEDLFPNRLERAKQAIEKFIEQLEGDRIGIIVFAGDAYVQLPITTDYGAAKLFLQSINTDLIPVQGTSIGKAIEKAVESFGKDIGKNKAIVIITDGENHEENVKEITDEAASKGVIINTIGIGSINGVPIPKYESGTKIGYRKDKEGNTIVTKLNENLLIEIASAGNGAYVKASNTDFGLDEIMNQLKEIERKQLESKMYTDYEDQFQLFFGIVFILLIIEFFINEKKSVWWNKLNLFERNQK